MTSSSYMLDRELLGSARNIIDANSNTMLSQHTTYRSSYGTTNVHNYHGHTNGIIDIGEPKKAIADLQDQIRLLKKDIEKKDDLIQELTSIKDVHSFDKSEFTKYETLAAQEHAAYEHTKRELEQFKVKVEGLNQDLRETKLKLAGKDERINELKHEIESIKREHESTLHTNNQLGLRIRELESNVSSYDSVANKSTLTITALQKDAKEKQEQIIELQSRLRIHIEQRETSERRVDGFHKKLQELFSQLNITLGTDLGQSVTASFDKLMATITDINTDNLTLKGRFAKLEETNRMLDTEVLANRSAIQQMANQLHAYEQDTVNLRLQVDSLRAERDTGYHERDAAKAEVETLKGRLDSVQKAWQNTRNELDQRENKYTSHESHIKQVENDLLYVKSNFDGFKQHVAQLLSDGYVKVEPNEDEIKDKILLLMKSSKDRGSIITNLQNQKEQVTKQLQDQIDINKDCENKRCQLESRVYELEQRIKTLDSNYTTNEVYRENLKQDKAKFLHFLERLGAIMKIENVSNELGYEVNPDVLLTRAEQLMKLEKDSIADQKTTIYSLQRKNKQFKEQIENKDLHLDLLRKKIIALEEGRAAKTDLEREIDDHVMLSRKMKVKVDSLTQQVSELKNENTQLKAQITDIQMLKNRLTDQEKEIRRLLEDIDKLVTIRDKQAVKISSLQDKIHSIDDEANRSLLSSDNAVRALSNEVRLLKSSLEKLSEREQRLLDFRSLVARMLGLDSKALTIPDYEITARLERLISVAQPSVVVPVVAAPTTQSNTVTHEHRFHYPHNNSHSAHARHRSPSPVTRHVNGNDRARSISPKNYGLDPRTY